MTTAEVEQTTDAGNEKNDDRLCVQVDDLINGHELTHPIYDQTGVLLLAEGSEINGQTKRQLKSRNFFEVEIHRDDAKHATLQAVQDNEASWTLGKQLSSKLDEVIDSGELFVANSGPAVKESLVFHGCKAYDPKQREELMEKHAEVSKGIDNMIQDALRGERIDGFQMVQMTSDYLSSMVDDRDAVMSVASEVVQDREIADHCLQMSLLAMAIAVEQGLDEENVRTVGLCGLVHDWGMSRVPREIRSVDRILTSEEMVLIKKHPIYSLEMLQNVSGIPRIVPIVCYQVHERPNQTGYPRGRSGSVTHLFARILNVADTFVALTSLRSYRKPMMPYEAMKCLLQLSQRKCADPQIVRSLLSVVSLFPTGSFVALSNGALARVLRSNGDKYATPIVQVVQDKDGYPIINEKDKQIIDLSEGEVTITQALATPGRRETALTDELLDLSER